MNPAPIGYFPRKRNPFPEGLSRFGVKEIGNLGHYGSDGPANWIDQWRHNEMWLYDSETLVKQVIADAIEIHLDAAPQRDPPWLVRLSRQKNIHFDFYAYKIFSVRFIEGAEETFELPPLNVEPFPNDYRRLGYDAANKTCCACFECSPLFCNGMCDEIKVNEFCLIDEPERALEVAKYFSVRKPEPGTYYVIEVWRKVLPDSSSPKE